MKKQAITYRNHYLRRLNLLLTLPNEWQEVSREGVAGAFVGVREDGYSPNIVLYALPIAGDDDEAMRSVIIAAEQSFAALDAETEIGEIEVDTYPATLYTYRWHDAVSNLDATQYRLFLQVGQVIFIIVFNTSTATEKKNKKAYDHFVQSVRFVPPTPTHWVDVVTYVPRVAEVRA